MTSGCIRLVCTLSLAMGMILPSAALGCPLCSEETEAKQEATGVNAALGFSISVLVMLAVPMSLVGGLGYALYRQQQRMGSGGGGGGGSGPPV